jgi:hypothetical protein
MNDKVSIEYYASQEARKAGTLSKGELSIRVYTAGEQEEAMRRAQRQVRDRSGAMQTWYDNGALLRAIFETATENGPLPHPNLWTLVTAKSANEVMRKVEEANGLTKEDIKNSGSPLLPEEAATPEQGDGSTSTLSAERTTASRKAAG